MAATATGRLEMIEGRDVVVFERRFRAPLDDVWAAVTEPDRLARWIGTWHGDPESGSVQFQMTAEGDDVPKTTYQIETCEPPHRLDLKAVDDFGTWLLRLTLDETQGFTTLTFTQVLDNLEGIDSIGPGWDYYLDRLVAAETGEDPAALDFERDYFPALADHYRTLRSQRN